MFEDFIMKYWKFLATIIYVTIFVIRAEMRGRQNSKDIVDRKNEHGELKKSVDDKETNLEKKITENSAKADKVKSDIESKIEEEMKSLEDDVEKNRVESAKANGHIYTKVDATLEHVNENFLRKDDALVMFKTKGEK